MSTDILNHARGHVEGDGFRSHFVGFGVGPLQVQGPSAGCTSIEVVLSAERQGTETQEIRPNGLGWAVPHGFLDGTTGSINCGQMGSAAVIAVAT